MSLAVSLLLTQLVAAPCAGEFCLGTNQFRVNEAGRVLVLPASPPPSRTRCSFDKVDNTSADGGVQDGGDGPGAHVEVIWEPNESAPLARFVNLSQGTWQVSFYATPLQHSTDPYANLAWSIFQFAEGDTPVELKRGTPRHARAYRRILPGNKDDPSGLPCGGSGDGGTPGQPPCGGDTDAGLSRAWIKNGWEAIPISFTWMPTENAEQLMARFGTQGEVFTPVGSERRAFGLDVPTLVGDVSRAVADAAVGRAEERALHVVKERLVNQLCGAWLDQTVERLVALEPAEARQAPQPVFSSTCETLKQIRLESLAGIGPSLRKALQEDLGRLAERLVRERFSRCLSATAARAAACGPLQGQVVQGLQYAVVLGAVAGFVIEAAQPDGASLGHSQLLVRQVMDAVRQYLKQNGSQIKLDIIPQRGTEAERMALRLGLVVAATGLAWCHANGHCDTHLIRQVVSEPQRFFKLEGLEQGLEKALEAEAYRLQVDKLVSIVSAGLEVMAPRKGEDAREAARRAASLTFDVLGMAIEAGCEPRGTNQCKEARAQVERLRTLVKSIVEVDMQTAIVAGVGFLVLQGSEAARLQGVARGMGALSAYAATYEGVGIGGAGGAPLSKEELHLQRVRAIEALANVASERTLRIGEDAFSLGVMPGLRGFVALSRPPIKPTEDNPSPSQDERFIQERWGGQPTFPVGIAWQHLYSENCAFFAQIPVLDVGQYATFASGKQVELSPWSSVVFGAQAGIQYKETVFSVDFRYIPRWGGPGTEGDYVTVGAQVGLYLPLLYLQ